MRRVRGDLGTSEVFVVPGFAVVGDWVWVQKEDSKGVGLRVPTFLRGTGRSRTKVRRLSLPL